MTKSHQEDQDEPFFIAEEVEVELTAAGCSLRDDDGAGGDDCSSIFEYRWSHRHGGR